MSDSIETAEATAEQVIAGAEKVTNVLGLTDVTAQLEQLKNAVEATVVASQAAIAQSANVVSAFKGLIDSLRAHLDSMNPMTEINAAKTKMESLFVQFENVFKTTP